MTIDSVSNQANVPVGPNQAQIIDAFISLLPAQRRATLIKLYRSLVPSTYVPRWPPPGLGADQLRDYAAYEVETFLDTQSAGFMNEMIPLMIPYLAIFGRPRTVTALDVGARTGAGSALLASVFQKRASLQIELDTLDLNPVWQEFQSSRWPSLRKAMTGDAFDLEESSYDFVVCSHTIEHVEDPIRFVRKLTKVAREFVFFYCPYDEVDPIPGHNPVTDDFVDRLQPIGRKVLKSWWWRKGSEHEMQKCIFFVLPGSRRI